MSHSNEFWNFGNADRSEDTPKGYFTPLFPHNLGRPLHHPEQDYNAHLISQIIKGYRVIGSGTDGVMTTDDLELGIKLHEVDPTDADYLHYIACGCKDEEWIWVPAEMGGTATSPLTVTAVATDSNICTSTYPAISAYGQGGAGQPYEYSLQASNAVPLGNITDWSPVSQFTTFNGSPLVVNQTYWVYVKDALNSFAISSAVTVGEIVPHTVNLTVTQNASFPGAQDVELNATVTGGIGPFTYTLYQGTDPNDLSTATIIGPSQGYTTTSTDVDFPVNMSGQIYSIGSGSYFVIVVDSSTTCESDSTVVTATQPDELDAVYTATNAFCEGYDHTFLFDEATGGTGPYEYSITDPNTTGYTWSSTLSYTVAPGNTSVYPAVKDATGYIVDLGIHTFEDPVALDFTVGSESLSCTTNSILFSGLTGGPGINIWPHPPEWQFSIDNGDTWAPAPSWTENPVGSNYNYLVLAAGTYSCKVRRIGPNGDAGCESMSKDVVVTAADEVTFDSASVNDTLCGSAGSGVINLTNIEIGGQTPTTGLTYTVVLELNGTIISTTNGLATPSYDITGLNGGLYNVTVIDDNGGCDKSESITITEDGTSISTFTVTADDICPGSTGPIQWLFEGAANGTTTQIFETLNGVDTLKATSTLVDDTGSLAGYSAGTYNFKLVDSNGCETLATGIVSESDAPVLILTGTSPTCGLPNGVITATAPGLSNPEYLLTDSNSGATTNFTGIFPGVSGGIEYTVTVISTDSLYCSLPSDTITLTASNGVTVVLDSQTNITCNGDSDGAISVTANGPVTSGVTTVWTGPNSYTSNILNISNLEAGTYNLTYTDNDTGCSANLTVILTEPDAIASLAETYTGGCQLYHSGLRVSATGGTGNYTFDLYADNGTIGGEDSADNLIDTQTGIIPGTAILYGGENWNQPTVWNLPDANGYPGFYYIIVTDDNGCTTTNFFEIPPCQAVITDNSTVACNGDNASSISVTTTDGSGSYEFSDDNLTWSQTYTGNPSTHTFNGIYQGGSSYIFYVRNTNDPTEVIPVTHTVAHPDPVSATILASTDESIAGAVDGAINLENIIGGSGSYASIELYDATSNTQIGSISSPVQNTPYAFSGLAAGNYYIIITDDNGCESDKIFATIGVSGSPLTFTSYPGNITCFGGTTDVNVVVNGGSGTFRFSNDNGTTWTNYLTQASYNFTGMAAGIHTIIVEDQQSYPGNPMDDDITLNQPTEVIATINSTSDETITGQNDGTISIEMSGGTPDYVLSLYGQNGLVSTITGSVGQTTYQWSNLEPGTYSYTAEDSIACDASTTNITIASGSPQINAIINPGTILCHGGAADMVMTTSDGSGDYQYAATPTLDATPPTNWNATTQDTTYTWSAGAGLKYYWVKDAVTGTEISVAHTETQPDPISVSYNGAETYPGADDASIQIFIDGGTALYTATCTETGEILTNLQDEAPGVPSGTFTTITSAGTYNILITDANGCTEPSVLSVVTLFNNIVIDSVTSTPTCYGEADGIISFSASGGFGSTYEWSKDGGNTWTQDITFFDGLTGADYGIFLRDYSTGETLEWSSNPVTVVEADEIQVITSTMTDGTCNAFPEYYIKFSGSNLTSDIAANQSVQLTWVGGSPVGNIMNIASLGNNEFEGSISFDSFSAPENNNGTFNVKITSDGCEKTDGPISYTSLDDIVLTYTPVSEPECPGDGWVYNVYATGGGTSSYNLMSSPAGATDYITGWDGAATDITVDETVSGSTALLAQHTDYASNGCQSNVVVVDSRQLSAMSVSGNVYNPGCATSGTSTYSFTMTGGLPGGTTNNTYKYKVSTDGGTTWGPEQSYSGAVSNQPISNGSITIKGYRIVNGNSTEDICDVEEILGTVTNPNPISGSIDSAGTISPTECTGAGATDGNISMNISGGTGTYTFSKNGGSTFVTLIPDPGNGTYNFTSLAAGTYSIVAKDSNGCIAFTDTVTLATPASPSVSSHNFQGCWRHADGAQVELNIFLTDIPGQQNGEYSFYNAQADVPTVYDGKFLYSSSDMTTHVQTNVIITELATGCSTTMSSFNFTAVPSIVSTGSILDVNSLPTAGDVNDFVISNVSGGLGAPYMVELLDSNGNNVSSVTHYGGTSYIYDIAAGDYTYRISDYAQGTTGCGRTYTTPMTATVTQLNEETFYHFHMGINVYPFTDLMTAGPAYLIGDTNYTQYDISIQSNFDLIMSDLIDNSDGTNSTCLPGTFEFGGPIDGQQGCNPTWTHNVTGAADFYYIAVPNNSLFNVNLVTAGFLQFNCTGTYNASSRKAFTYSGNGESYWLYKMTNSSGTAALQYGFK